MSAPGVGRSPPTQSPVPYNSYNANNNDFLFAFPKFGDLPGSFMNNGSLAKAPTTASSNSQSSRGSASSMPNLVGASSSSQSPTTKSSPHANGASAMVTNSPTQYERSNSGFNGGGLEELNGLFSPSILESARRNNSTDYNFTSPKKSSSADSYRALANTPNLANNASNGSTGSPSASSMSHAGLDSSCGTTPEHSANSPEYRKTSEGQLNTINEEGNQIGNQGKLNSCNERAKPRDPNIFPANTKSPSVDFNGIDYLAQQNGGQFDPVLFGDYRDPQDNIMNSAFGDFFNDAFLNQDFNSQYNVGDLSNSPSSANPPPSAAQKVDPLTQCDAAQKVNDDPEKPRQFLTCDKLWLVLIILTIEPIDHYKTARFADHFFFPRRDRVQNSEKITSGLVDMDDLCSQLKSKARCSGTGAVVDQADVDAILGPAPEQQKGFLSMFT